MTDVVKLARERQARLSKEITKLERFIHMADALLMHSAARELRPDERVPTVATDHIEFRAERP